MLSRARTIAAKLARRPVPFATDTYLTLTTLPKEDAGFRDIWAKCEPYTMTSFTRGLSVFRSIRHLVENGIDGDIIECGVWRGGSTMIAMLTLMQLNAADRRFVLFDTFEGMTEPGQADLDLRGTPADRMMKSSKRTADGIWCIASLDEVKRNIAATGYPSSLVTYVKGDIRETLKVYEPGPVALLRLDTDFYDSTKLEMERLYPYLRGNGILIVDDYGHWDGARKAVDEYVAAVRQSGKPAPMLQLIDYTGRIAIKPL